MQRSRASESCTAGALVSGNAPYSNTGINADSHGFKWHRLTNDITLIDAASSTHSDYLRDVVDAAPRITFAWLNNGKRFMVSF